MTTLTMPATPGFMASRFELISNTRTFISPLTGAGQTLELPGARWRASYTLPPLQRPLGAAWQAFLLKLRGQAGRFYGFDPDATVPQGVATGTPLVKGSGQTGTALITNGWTPSVVGILKAGDYIAYDTTAGRQLHMVTADASSDGTGQATLAIEPPIRTSPANNATIITASASCIMRLETPEIGWDGDEISYYGFAFSAVEAI